MKKQVRKRPAKSPGLSEPVRSSPRTRPKVDYSELEASSKKKKTAGSTKTVMVDIDVKKNVTDVNKEASSEDRENSFSCPDCNRSFKFHNSLAKHIQASHLQIEFKCESCDKSFKYKTNLKRHVDKDHNESEVKYQCLQCSKLFMYSCTLKKHIRNKHL